MAVLPSIVFQYTLSQDASGNSSNLIKKISIVSSTLIAILAIILTPTVLPIIFPEYIEAIQLVQIVSLQVIPSSVILAYNSKFLGEEKSRYLLIGQGIAVVIYLGGLFTLGTLMGINGIAISLVLASTGHAIFYIICAQYLKNQEKN